MRSIHFANYELHKAQHDAIKENLLLFEQDIIASDYSPQSIKHLLGIMMAWLTYHTIEIDSVIGKEIPRIDCSNDAAVALEKAVVRISSELFRIVLTLANGNYRGFPLGQKIFCYTDWQPPGWPPVLYLVRSQQTGSAAGGLPALFFQTGRGRRAGTFRYRGAECDAGYPLCPELPKRGLFSCGLCKNP